MTITKPTLICHRCEALFKAKHNRGSAFLPTCIDCKKIITTHYWDEPKNNAGCYCNPNLLGGSGVVKTTDWDSVDCKDCLKKGE